MFNAAKEAKSVGRTKNLNANSYFVERAGSLTRPGSVNIRSIFLSRENPLWRYAFNQSTLFIRKPCV